ncbi:hypothetical protein M378DRAFT_57283, partial [Amanita muscaria Koide BX008]
NRSLSQQWKSLFGSTYWEQLMKEKKKEHGQMYPNYAYCPQRNKEKAKNKK